MELLAVLIFLGAGLFIYVMYRIRQVYLETQAAHAAQIREGMAGTQPIGCSVSIDPATAAGLQAAMMKVGDSMQGTVKAFSQLADAISSYDLVRTHTHWQWHRVGIDKHDIWVGLYWKFEELFEGVEDGDFDKLTIYICPLPCVLISFARVRGYKLVPHMDRRIDPVCKHCSARHSQHPVVITETEHCTGKF